MAKREIWLSESKYGRKNSKNEWEECTKHYSKGAAMRAAKKCQEESGIKHRVRKQSTAQLRRAATED